MGKPMASHLVKAGYPLTVLSSSKEASYLRTAGASTAENAGKLVANSDVIITMLPDSPEVESVVLGSDGILKHARKGMLFIDMSTIAPSMAVKVYAALASAGIQSLDAPVSGGRQRQRRHGRRVPRRRRQGHRSAAGG